jgi:hypothetical protein
MAVPLFPVPLSRVDRYSAAGAIARQRFCKENAISVRDAPNRLFPKIGLRHEIWKRRERPKFPAKFPPDRIDPHSQARLPISILVHVGFACNAVAQAILFS